LTGVLIAVNISLISDDISPFEQTGERDERHVDNADDGVEIEIAGVGHFVPVRRFASVSAALLILAKAALVK
jgi:hypothetical protein